MVSLLYINLLYLAAVRGLLGKYMRDLVYLRIMFLTDFMKSLYSFDTVTDAAGALVCASVLPGEDVGDKPLDTALSQVNVPILISIYAS